MLELEHPGLNSCATQHHVLLAARSVGPFNGNSFVLGTGGLPQTYTRTETVVSVVVQ